MISAVEQGRKNWLLRVRKLSKGFLRRKPSFLGVILSEVRARSGRMESKDLYYLQKSSRP
jgi:hypothetical protein